MNFKAVLALAFCLMFSKVCFAEGFETIEDEYTAQSLLEALEQGYGIAGNPTSPRELPNNALALIKHFEGWRPKAYNDPAGYCTIGYGHLLALRPCNITIVNKVKEIFEDFDGSLTEAQGEQLLVRDTAFARNEVLRLTTVNLNDDEFGALTSFVFNVGGGNYANSTLLKRLNAGERDLAARQFGRWKFANGQELPGLIIRRDCERTLFVGDLSVDGDDLKRSDCTTFGIADAGGVPIDIRLGE